jgi:signal transduction histidine kinase
MATILPADDLAVNRERRPATLRQQGHRLIDTAGGSATLDVAERHRRDEQYRQAQKMEAVGRLAVDIAHDFNNFLTVILGNCQMLVTDLAADDPRQEYISEIHTAGLSAAKLARELLTFSCKQTAETEPGDTKAVAKGVGSRLG